MSQRAEPHDSLDYFPTPPWATRALCEWLRNRVPEIGRQTAWDPACGEGYMVRPLREYFKTVHASDVHDYSCRDQEKVADFLFVPARTVDQDFPDVDWIITNPPFRLGLEFALTAQGLAKDGVCLLVRTAFLEGGDRWAKLFGRHPPEIILQFCERVPMVKGRYDPKASTATSYCWIIWRKCQRKDLLTRFAWIPPSRKRLELPTDYAEAA